MGENLFGIFILIDNYSQFVKELMENQSIEFDKIICCVMDHLVQIQNQTKIEQLAKFIGYTCFEKQSLTNIDHEINSLDDNEDNSSKIPFLKKVSKEIDKRSTSQSSEYASMLFI
jgi:hypothetical protein